MIFTQSEHIEPALAKNIVFLPLTLIPQFLIKYLMEIILILTKNSAQETQFANGLWFY
jgi:hypothetical protein